MVTRSTPGTCFMPSFCIALRAFFSLRLCFPPSASSARDAGNRSARRRSDQPRLGPARRRRLCGASRRTLPSWSRLHQRRRPVVVRVVVVVVVVVVSVLRARAASANARDTSALYAPLFAAAQASWGLRQRVRDTHAWQKARYTPIKGGGPSSSESSSTGGFAGGMAAERDDTVSEDDRRTKIVKCSAQFPYFFIFRADHDGAAGR